MTDKLANAAIIREGVLYSGFRRHTPIRAKLGDENPHVSNSKDQEGYLTVAGRFINREEAVGIALAAGQLGAHPGGPLVSSDINWECGLDWQPYDLGWD